jgi:hypothetical protein
MTDISVGGTSDANDALSEDGSGFHHCHLFIADGIKGQSGDQGS